MNNIKTRLPFFGVIKVTGEDAVSFLHNQLSNDIQNLPINGACYASYNTPKGRVLANILVLKTENELFLILAHDLCMAMVKRLRMYVLRSKVILEEADQYALAVHFSESMTPFDATTQLPTMHLENDLYQIKLPYGGEYLFGLAEDSELPPVNEEHVNLWARHEIEVGMPWINAESSDKFVAQMLNLHQTGAVHFKKGCYPGQEIIARAQYRGQVKRGLISLTLSKPLAVGDVIYNAKNEEVGLLVNTTQMDGHLFLGLAVVKFQSEKESLFINQSQVMISKIFFSNEQE